MVVKLHTFQHDHKVLTLRMERLKAKMASIIEKQGVCVDEETSSDIERIMTEEESGVLKSYPKGSFQQLFWQQQKEAASKHDKRGMRWHPLFIKWCIYLRHQSNKAYDTLRLSGCVHLPSQRTLRDYSNCVKAGSGFSVEVDAQLMEAAKLSTCPDWQKLVVLLLDEMHIKEDVVYNKHTGRIVGFCNLGEVNSRLLQYESMLEGKEEHHVVAKSMMVFMVRGLFTPLRYNH